jgi:hypothetical protein
MVGQSHDSFTLPSVKDVMLFQHCQQSIQVLYTACKQEALWNKPECQVLLCPWASDKIKKKLKYKTAAALSGVDLLWLLHKIGGKSVSVVPELITGVLGWLENSGVRPRFPSVLREGDNQWVAGLVSRVIDQDYVTAVQPGSLIKVKVKVKFLPDIAHHVRTKPLGFFLWWYDDDKNNIEWIVDENDNYIDNNNDNDVVRNKTNHVKTIFTMMFTPTGWRWSHN